MNPISKTNSHDPFVNRNRIEPHASGLLDGLSFAVKDNIDIAGEVTGYGSPGWAQSHGKAAANAICLEQLLSAGGCCHGKTKSDELAYSLLGINDFYGTPLNPKAPERIPGGSSSGSAAAVAGGSVDFALGTDTGGSIRVPASNCGIWGYRPTHGSISVAGVLGLAPSYDTLGVLASSGEILEKVMQILLAESSSEASLSVCLVDDVLQMCDQKLLDAAAPLLGKISPETITLAEISEPYVTSTWLFEQLGFLLSTEIWSTLGSWVNHQKPQLSPGVEFSLQNYAAAADRREIQERLVEKKAFQQALNKFLADDKVLCFPTTVDPAPRLADITPEFMAGDYVPRAMSVNAISGLSGTPQISIPLIEVDGVPIGLSFVAGHGQDMALINTCNRLFAPKNNRSPI